MLLYVIIRLYNHCTPFGVEFCTRRYIQDTNQIDKARKKQLVMWLTICFCSMLCSFREMFFLNRGLLKTVIHKISTFSICGYLQYFLNISYASLCSHKFLLARQCYIQKILKLQVFCFGKFINVFKKRSIVTSVHLTEIVELFACNISTKGHQLWPGSIT